MPVFLISRYHDYLRSGADFDRAVKAAMISIGKVITASATTVGITFLLLSFAKMGVFRTVGVAAAIGIAIAYLAGVTLLPAILVLAGPRGWVKPRRELTARFWRRSGIRIVPRPVPHLVASCAHPGHYWPAVRPSRDTTMTIARPSRRRRRARSGTPRWNVISPSASRSPNSSSSSPHMTCARRSPLADLEQMASRVAQLPNVGLVSGITRPLGEVPPEFRATYQAGLVGTRLADGSALIDQRTGDLNRLASGANTLADSLADVRAQVNKIAPSIQSLIDSSLLDEEPIRGRQAGARRRQRCQARRQHQRARQRNGRELHRRQGPVRLDRARS